MRSDCINSSLFIFVLFSAEAVKLSFICNCNQHKLNPESIFLRRIRVEVMRP